MRLGSQREDGLAAPPSLGPNDTIQLRCHDEVVLVEALDLVGVKRHGRVAPAEGDVRVMAMALSLGQIGGPLHERERLDEILEPKRALDPVRVLERGYAIATDASGAVLRDATQVTLGVTVQVRLHRGKLLTEVKKQEES